MPSLSNGTEGALGSPPSLYLFYWWIALPQVLWGGRAQSHIWHCLRSFTAFPSHCPLPLFLLFLEPQSPGFLGRDAGKRQKRLWVVKKIGVGLGAGILSGVVRSQETWIFALELWLEQIHWCLGDPLEKNEDLNYSSLISWANIFEHLLCSWDAGRRKGQVLLLRSSQRVSIWGLCIS